MKEQGTGIRDQGSGKGPRWFIGPGVILLAAAVAVAPQLIRGNSCGHDFDFHLVSWFDCLNSWHHGIPYPHWTPSANFGAGEPRFVFYPPLTWMLGAALGIVLPWKLVPIALTWLLLAATGLATRVLALEALDDGAATLAGCAALFSGYALFCAYERSAFGELTGGFWIPLLLLFALRASNTTGSLWRRAFDGSAFPLALVVAGAWLSNVPVGIMACYLLAAVALAASLLTRSWAPALRAAVAAAVGIGLAGIYLVPAAWEQRWVDIRQATGDPGEMIENSWLFARHANPLLSEHDVELRKVSIVAAAMLALALGGVLVSWLRRRRLAVETSGQEPSLFKRSDFWIPLALIPAGILLLQLPFSLPVWNLLPKLRLLQFPWRWLVALEAPMAIFATSAIWPKGSGRQRQRIAIGSVCAAIFIAATAYSGMAYFQVCDDEDAVRPMADVYRSGAGFEGTDEYEPPGADNSMVATGLPFACLVSDPSVVLGAIPAGEDAGTQPAWDAAQGTCEATVSQSSANNQNERQFINPEHLNLLVIGPHPGFLILRLRSYPAWQVKVNGSLATAMPTRDDGLVAVPVPPGPLRLKADWTVTPDVIAGRGVGIVALLLLIGLCFTERSLRIPRDSKRPL